MANLTIMVDDAVLQRARVRAVRMNTSVNAVLARYLETFAEQLDAQAEAIDELLEISEESDNRRNRVAARRRGRRRWTRDSLHER
jgi:hypothetical protein